MRSQFGHFGDVVEGLREIYDGTRERATRWRIIELTGKLAELEGDKKHLRISWPSFDAIARRVSR